MSHLTHIYDVWNGNAELLAADIGESGVTVRQWRNRGSIPPKYWLRIKEAAEARGKTIDIQSFIPPSIEAAECPSPTSGTEAA